jgi:hypothetical protein
MTMRQIQIVVALLFAQATFLHAVPVKRAELEDLFSLGLNSSIKADNADALLTVVS